MTRTLTTLVLLFCSTLLLQTEAQLSKKITWSKEAQTLLQGKQILYVEREQYARDHHNTETLFQVGEINEDSFQGGSALRILHGSDRAVITLLESPEGVIRDPELSFDAQKIVFSWRKNRNDYYHIYEIAVDGTGLKQLTFAEGVSDIDPLYLPDGGILFSSSREPKYCMCNRHIMCNLYRMNADGTNITQLGVSTLFEGHSSLLHDGRVLYDRWEYVDRNFGDAQGLWTVNPDGTKHTVYYGNNTKSPGAVIDGRAIPGSDLIVCTFSSCHDRPWGAIAVVDRKKGVDGAPPVVRTWPADAVKWVDNGGIDTFMGLPYFYEDAFPINKDFFLCSGTVWLKRQVDSKSGIFLLGMNNREELLFESVQSLFDPMIIEARPRPSIIPFARNFTDKTGTFYVQNVYEGTHMQGVEKGAAKYLRVIESPAKLTWSASGWMGEGEQAPGMNWHSFELKRILGDVPIEEDGSANFIAPANTFVYFQLLDGDKKMIQSMRSGTMLMPGETTGCIGCHEDRLMTPNFSAKQPLALKKPSQTLLPFGGKAPSNFSFMEHVQPILTRHCASCHDFDPKDRQKLVLTKDRNPFFNAAYISLYMKEVVRLVGGGPATIQQPYSWGSHASQLTRIVDSQHNGVKLSKVEKEMLYAWMDCNGVYYPTYETSFHDNPGGRSPLTTAETRRLGELTGVNLLALNGFQRKLLPQISFDRPEISPCLDAIRNDKANYKEALALIRRGQKRLKETPRGDVEKELVVCDHMQRQLENYAKQLELRHQMNRAISEGRRISDQP